MTTYTTIQGDMWDLIAYKTLGTTALTDRLIEANSAHRQVHIFPAGVELVIPAFSAASTPEGLPPWKRVAR